MNQPEQEMINILKDLKENHNVIAVKAEFEAEGTRFEEALRLKDIVTKAGLNLTIKIGGCEAIKDMYEVKLLGVSTVVAPMIETAYAMKKFVQAINLIFTEEERKNIKFLINIETITGFNNIDEIVESPYFKDLNGIVLGRVDMTGSMGLSRKDINTDKIFEIANILAKKMQSMNKEFVIGGGVSPASIPFFKKLPADSLSKFETRKIIFDAKNALKNSKTEEGILKALNFELMWLKNKQEFYGKFLKEDEARIKLLTQLYEKSLQETCIFFN